MTNFNIAYFFGFIGAGLMVTSYLMKSMLPLRVVALVACLFLVLYGYLAAAMPTLLLYGALIPINIKKTMQIHKLVRAIENAKSDTPISEWLLPNMTRRTARAEQPSGKRATRPMRCCTWSPAACDWWNTTSC